MGSLWEQWAPTSFLTAPRREEPEPRLDPTGAAAAPALRPPAASSPAAASVADDRRRQAARAFEFSTSPADPAAAQLKRQRGEAAKSAQGSTEHQDGRRLRFRSSGRREEDLGGGDSRLQGRARRQSAPVQHFDPWAERERRQWAKSPSRTPAKKATKVGTQNQQRQRQKADEIFYVERIDGSRKNGSELWIKWENYSESDNTWEPRDSLMAAKGVARLIRRYEDHAAATATAAAATVAATAPAAPALAAAVPAVAVASASATTCSSSAENEAAPAGAVAGTSAATVAVGAAPATGDSSDDTNAPRTTTRNGEQATAMELATAPARRGSSRKHARLPGAAPAQHQPTAVSNQELLQAIEAAPKQRGLKLALEMVGLAANGRNYARAKALISQQTPANDTAPKSVPHTASKAGPPIASSASSSGERQRQTWQVTELRQLAEVRGVLAPSCTSSD
jgi:hypothetical protein